MAISMKKVLLALGAAGVLAGCATYDDGYYGARSGYYDDRYAYAPGYYEPGYVAPSVGLGFGYSYYDRGDYRHDRRGDRQDWRDRDRRSIPSEQAGINEPFSSRPLGTDNRGTTYWQGSDGRVYEGTLPPGQNPTASGG